LLRVFLREIGLLTSQEFNSMEIKQKKPQKVITLKLNNARKIFNPLNDYYLFELVSEDKNVLLGYLEVERFENNSKVLEKYRVITGTKINLTLGILFPSKDPPTT